MTKFIEISKGIFRDPCLECVLARTGKRVRYEEKVDGHITVTGDERKNESKYSLPT
jgi:hypothetical protein